MRFLNGWPLPGAYFFNLILSGTLAGQRHTVEIGRMSCLIGCPFTAVPCIDYINGMSRPLMFHSILLCAESKLLFQ